jgi:putative transposase
MRVWRVKQGVAVWAYCLMPDYVHLIAVLEAESGLAPAIREAHRRHTWCLLS